MAKVFQMLQHSQYSRKNVGQAQKIYIPRSSPISWHQFPPTPTPKCLDEHQHLGYFLVPIWAEIRRTDSTGLKLGQLLH